MDCLTFDDSVIAELRSVEAETGDPLVSVLVDMFLRDTPGVLKNMRSSLASGNLVELGRLAHGLKSTSGNLGMQGLMKVSGDLDAGIKQNKISALEAELIVAQMEHCYPLLADRLHRLKAIAA